MVDDGGEVTEDREGAREWGGSSENDSRGYPIGSRSPLELNEAPGGGCLDHLKLRRAVALYARVYVIAEPSKRSCPEPDMVVIKRNMG